MKNNTLIFIHGYRASSQTNWFPTLAHLLTELHVDFVIPDLPGHRQPDLDAWIETIAQLVHNAKKPVVLIGHSLGTRAILLYMEKYHPTTIAKVILFSPPGNWIQNGQRWGGTAYPQFFDHRINMDIIKHLTHFVVIHAKDDTDIPMKPGLDYAHGKSLANELDATLISPDTGGHFIRPEDAPYILSLIQQEIP